MAEVRNPAAEIHKLREELGEIPRELSRKLRPELRRAAEPIAADAGTRAAWSTRIPRAIAISAHLGKRNPGVSLRVRSKIAPHGRAYEGIAGTTAFLHPVFGHRDREVSQPARSYLAPAVAAAADRVVDAVAATVNRIARENGFR